MKELREDIRAVLVMAAIALPILCRLVQLYVDHRDFGGPPIP